MDTQQVSAPPRAPSRDLRGAVASRAMSSSAMSSSSAPASAGPDAGPSGVVHINSRHTACFTVVGNHLAQHRGLSLVAIALAVHIQSLPAGARIGVKVLADRFPESEARVAAALRELEAHGYLRRTRERLPNGRVVTRTVSYNQPGNQPGADVSPGHVPPTSARAAQRKAPLPSLSRTLSAPSRPVPAPTAHASATHAPRSCLVTESRVSVTPDPSHRSRPRHPHALRFHSRWSLTRNATAWPSSCSPACAGPNQRCSWPRPTSRGSLPPSPPGSNAMRIPTPYGPSSPPICRSL